MRLKQSVIMSGRHRGRDKRGGDHGDAHDIHGCDDREREEKRKHQLYNLLF